MHLIVAMLLIHPQIATVVPSAAFPDTSDSAMVISAASTELEANTPLPTATVSLVALASPASEPAEPALPSAPQPLVANPPASPAFLKSGKPMTISVDDLHAEYRRKQLFWTGLAIAASGAATFDAITTRQAITSTGARELDPLLKPFANNSSIFAAIQVGPAIMDFAARKMMYSRHGWLRRVWWVPQSASFVSSIFCGAHNLAFH